MKRDVAVDIRERVAGTVTVLEPLGRMVLSESPTDDVLKERVAEQLREGRRLLVLNLNQVSHMDTSGLTLLVAIYIAARKQGAVTAAIDDGGMGMGEVYAFGCVLYEMVTGKRATARRAPSRNETVGMDTDVHVACQ